MKTASRFGSQMSAGGFPQFQPANPVHPGSSHQPSNSTGLPPPSFNHAFNQGNTNSNANPFASANNFNGLAGGFGPGGSFNGTGTGLASLEAQRGFAHGAALQQQQQQRDQMRRTSGGASKGHMKSRIRDVWRGNLAQEMALLRELVEKYPYISMVRPGLSSIPSSPLNGQHGGPPSRLETKELQDTEFPGIVARPMGAFTTRADYHYQTLRCNVDLLKVIQLGITLFDENGEMPPPHAAEELGVAAYRNNLLPCPCTWQFNFQFSPNEDMCNQESITFLTEHGLDLEQHEQNGIDPAEFGALLITSGMAMFDDVKWISFHSGYDFAYLIKLMLCKELPEDESEYRDLMNLYFPSIYDIKYMIKHAQRHQGVNNTPLTPAAAGILSSLGPKSGLQDLADELGIKRLGVAHQAGSDSMLTGKVFWEVKKSIFNGIIDDEKYLGQIWGLGSLSPSSFSYNPNDPHHQHSGATAVTPNLNGATIYHPNANPTQGTPSTPASSSHTGGGSLTSPPNHNHQHQHQHHQQQHHHHPQQQHHPSLGNGGGMGNAMGSLTPGGGGGVFGGFRGFSGK